MFKTKKILIIFIILFTIVNITTFAADEEDPDYSAGLTHGQEVGQKDGVIKAEQDYKSGLSNNYKQSMNDEDEIIEIAGISDEDRDYREGFWDGYEEKFELKYKEKFRELRLAKVIENLEDPETTSEDGENYKKMDQFGGSITSEDGYVTLEIEEGTMFRENGMNIKKTEESYSVDQQNYIEVTDTYEVKTDKTIEVWKDMKLSFKYAGPDSAGIYKYNDGNWEYIKSTIEDDYITCQITDKFYNGEIYTVLIDRNTMMTDTKDNWARDEIDYALKNRFISGYQDGTFRPTNNITRSEAVAMLCNTYKWEGDYTSVNLLKYDDGILVKDWSKEVFKKAIASGIVNGFSDNTLRPNKDISYAEIEWLVRRGTPYSNFNWDDVAEKMLEEKKVFCESFKDKYNRIKRSEFAYLLYVLKTGTL